MKHQVYAAIMAGGAGTRFWPASTATKPKQFLDVLGRGRTLLQETFNRFNTFIPTENIKVVSGDSYAALIKSQLQTNDSGLINEPMMRNTAAAVALTAFEISLEEPDALIIMSPADHLIQKPTVFSGVLQKALDFAASKDALITVSIEPDSPHTGYGYIKKGEAGKDFYKVDQFTEKPDLAAAEEFIASGEFYWNAGIFVWSARSIVKAFFEYAPEIYQPLAKLYRKGKPGLEELNLVYQQLPSISVDYAIMEKASNVYTIAGDFGWSDLGSWKTIFELSNKDQEQNSCTGVKFSAVDSQQNLIRGVDGKLYAFIGMENTALIDTGNVVLVFPLERDQDVKKILEKVRDEHGNQFD
ncbi:MAG: mannose-1-phosphate guanylyltransferase [Saprospirales bacterium]|nr:MAG: mannose-1-phosphate guanylyltransferase [Saprospirales bacterium]